MAQRLKAVLTATILASQNALSKDDKALTRYLVAHEVVED